MQVRKSARLARSRRGFGLGCKIPLRFRDALCPCRQRGRRMLIGRHIVMSAILCNIADIRELVVTGRGVLRLPARTAATTTSGSTQSSSTTTIMTSTAAMATTRGGGRRVLTTTNTTNHCRCCCCCCDYNGHYCPCEAPTGLPSTQPEDPTPGDPKLPESESRSPLSEDLRGRLWKMEDFAIQFIALPSGVWNKIDAN